MKIDQTLFMVAFRRDVGFQDAFSQSTYLDRRTGDAVWTYNYDDDTPGEGIPAEDNREERERVAAEPVRYLKISGLDHGQHHEILRQFLQSDWTRDDARRRRAGEAYLGSIGAWKRRSATRGSSISSVISERRRSQSGRKSSSGRTASTRNGDNPLERRASRRRFGTRSAQDGTVIGEMGPNNLLQSREPIWPGNALCVPLWT